MLDPKKLEKLIVEARARVSWGESPQSIGAWLDEQGVNHATINEVLAASLRERDVEMRSKGLAELLIGLGITAVCGLSTYLMVTSGTGRSSVFAVCVAGSLYGSFRIIRGTTWLLLGKHSGGSVGGVD